jgi:hypothetical protein
MMHLVLLVAANAAPLPPSIVPANLHEFECAFHTANVPSNRKIRAVCKSIAEYFKKPIEYM